MNAADLTRGQVHLLTHAAAMGGWLSHGYINAARAEDMSWLAFECSPPLFDLVTVDEGRRQVWKLTFSGAATAEELSPSGDPQ